jgi:DNA (cytosine-5)-methyltransferase 1
MGDLSYIDLFAGIGGFRFAMEPFGARCVFSSEWDKHAADTYEANHGERPAGDITKIDENDIPSHDMICGGFPCQPFSVNGNQEGFGDVRGTLFFDIVRIAKRHRPKVLFLENVPNLETHDDGRTLRTIQKTMTDIGYHLHYNVLNASLFGVPHARERIILVAFRDDLGQDPNVFASCTFAFPTPSEGDAQKVYLKDVLVDPASAAKYVISSKHLRTIKDVPVYPRLAPIRIGMINSGRQGERIYHANGHAITLSSGGGGIGAKTGLYLVGDDVRRLTPRECARIMGLPESFVLNESDSQCYRQFGNGVVVNVLSAVMSNIVSTGVFDEK